MYVCYLELFHKNGDTNLHGMMTTVMMTMMMTIVVVLNMEKNRIEYHSTKQ